MGGSLRRAKALVARKVLEPLGLLDEAKAFESLMVSKVVKPLTAVVYKTVEPLAARAYRSRDITGWPRWAGLVLDVKTPATMSRLTVSSPSCDVNINIIFYFLDRTLDIPGGIVECGVFRGGSLTAMALYLKQRQVAKRIFGLDSFQGFDEDIHKDLQLGGADNAEKRFHGFDETSLSHVYSKIDRLNVTESVALIPGYFSNTLNTLPNCHFSFVHLDCDIYDSYKQTLEYFYYRMSPGGIILLDEYNDPPWPGCNLAVDEFLAGKAEKLSLISMDNHEKYFITKQAGGEHVIQ
jgi:hypothetical protein